MSVFIFCLILIGIGSLVNKLTRVDDIKKRKCRFASYDKDAQIEVGYPASNSRSLHMNSSMEPPLPNHNYTNEQLDRHEEEYDTNNKHVCTKNMFIESHYELNLSLFEKILTEKMVNDAYEKVLNEHLNNIEKGLEPPFELLMKKEARNYLLNHIKPQKN